MKKIIVALTFSLLLHSFAYSQNSGYLGKHFMFSAGMGVQFPAFLKVIDWNNGLTYRAFPSIKLQPVLRLEYILTDKNTIGIQYSRYWSYFNFDREVMITSHVTDDLWTWEKRTFSFWSDSAAEITGNAFAVNFKSFFKYNHLAPVGPYFKFELMLLPYKLHFDSSALKKNLTFDYDIKEMMYLPPSWTKFNYTEFIFNFGVGYQRVFLERIMLNVMAQSGLGMNGLRWLVHSNTEENYLRKQSSSAMLLQNLFSIEAGVGILIY